MVVAPLPARPRLTPLLLLAALVILVLALALLRLRTGPWYAVYGPDGTRVLEGAPASWEARYYLDVVANFVSDRPPTHGFAPVHHRTLVNLYLSSLLYAWTGRVHASFAAVDLLSWVLAGLAVYHVARRFGLTLTGSAIAALVTVASPILVSNMWRHDLHVANFATMALGLWTVVAALDRLRRERVLAAAIGAILLLLSLSYQYQWTLLPVLVVLLRARAGFTPVQTARITVSAVALFFLGTLAWHGLLHLGGLSPTGVDVGVVSDPGALLARRLAGVNSPADLRRLLPSAEHAANTVRAYHPLVFIAGWIGLFLLPRHVLAAAIAASAAALFAISLYSAPWTAMSAYPFLYVGVGRLCVIGYRWGPVPGAVIAAAGAILLMAVTNTDVWSDYRFMLAWWRQYAPQTVF